MTLAHTPAHHISYPDRFENEETGWGYSVLHDINAEDPRTWIRPEMAALWAFNEPRLSHSVAAEKPEGNIAIDAFAYFLDTYDAEAALEITRRYLAIYHPEKKTTLATATIRGYAQGDWLEVIAASSKGYGTPQDHIETFRQWAFGDVWVVIPDGWPGINGIYAEHAEAALEYFRENFEEESAHPKADVHVWGNTLPEAIATCLADREESAAVRAVAWLKGHENDSALWELLNHHLDTIQQMAATQTQE